MSNMLIVDPENTATKDMHQFLLGAVAPRPIAFVSTVDENGKPNLAPYSFFNAFSSNPPMVIFSSNRRVLNNTTKDTLHNIEKTREAVINVVNHSIVRQMTITSIEWEQDINEFEKAGLTPIPSDLVKPFRVKESPVHMECRVEQIIPLGEHGGAGNLMLCRVLRMHINEEILGERNRIDPHKIDLMGRMGRAYYVRASGPAVHTIVQPVTKLSIGYDQLPQSIRESKVLTGNAIGQLAGVLELPGKEAILALKEEEAIQTILQQEQPLEALHQKAMEALEHDDRERAIKLALLVEHL